MIDICILNQATEEVVFVKADENEIVEKYENNVELYIRDYLQFNLDEISYMTATAMECQMYGGTPFGGLTVTNNGYWD